MSDLLLQVNNLRTAFVTEKGPLYAVDDVSFDLKKGRTLGIVGESGCGKSVTALSIMRLVPIPPGKIVQGQIFYRGKNLLSLSPREMRRIRGNEISMIFQDPMTSLNPVFTIGNQILEAIRLHQDLSRKEARNLTVEMLRKVGIPAPEQRIHDYPHQLSGGMRQRVMIAMALSCRPSLLIADEPTTALDVTIQAQILELIKSLQMEFGMSIMLITHDLGVIAETCDEVVVMYCGKIVEYADVTTLFEHPMHPYTIGLLHSIPSLGKGRLAVIPGLVPDLLNLPKGCRFQERCPWVKEDCRLFEPPLEELEPGHWVRCFHSLEHVAPRSTSQKRNV